MPEYQFDKKLFLLIINNFKLFMYLFFIILIIISNIFPNVFKLWKKRLQTVTTHPIKHYTHSKFKVISYLINTTIKCWTQSNKAL